MSDMNTKKSAIIPVVQSQPTEHNYHVLAQSHASNQLLRQMTLKVTDPSHLDIYGNAEIESTGFKLSIAGYTELANGINPSAAMLLDSLMITATQEGFASTLIRLPLKEYMEWRGLNHIKETRKQLKRDLDALDRISFEYKGTGKQRNSWLKVSLSGGTSGQVRNGDIIYRFNQDFYDSFRAGVNNKYLYMYFPHEALNVNTRQNPHKYWLARRIAEHKRMNLGKRNEDIIGVRTLIEACPHLPTYDEVISSRGKSVAQRIITPFERDMGVFNQSFTWQYNNIDDAKDYKTFISATVKIIWNDYPDTTELQAKKAKRAKKKPSAK